MLNGDLAALTAEVQALSGVRALGRVQGLRAGLVEVAGLGQRCALGDRAEIARRALPAIAAEVVRIGPEGAVLMPEAQPEGVRRGDGVRLIGPSSIAPHSGWIGRILDPDGRPLDGRPLLRGPVARAYATDPPPAARRRTLGARLETGLAVFNTALPLARGQRLGLFAGSGVGKSSLLGALARGVAADVVVVALVGERGRELRQFTEEVLGAEGMRRAVVVTATSDRSALARRRCAWAAMAVAEHFRDEGLHVLLLADSLTRFAEAHREVALAAGEGAALRGHPPSLVPALMALAERAGPGEEERAGDITAVFTVLVQGSDMEEPVADILRGALDGHVVLSRAIAERGRYPAVDLVRSVSRSLPTAANEAENALIARLRQVLGTYDSAETMIRAGLYSAGSDAALDEAVRLWPRLDAFLSEPEPGNAATSFARLAALLDGTTGEGAARG